MNAYSLFSGIGGLDVALAPWVRTIGFCEIDPVARAVLARRFPKCHIADDVRTLRINRHVVDILMGGFPCQDLSVAGKRAGLDGERSGLYREVLRLTEEAEPIFVFLENVPGVIKYMPRIRGDFAKLGFRLRAGRLSASQVGAPHKRDRVFMLAAHTERLLLWQQPGRGSGASGQEEIQPGADDQARGAADADPQGQLQQGWTECEVGGRRVHDDSARNWQAPDDPVRLLDDGLSLGLAGQRLLGNSVVPLQARAAFMELMGLK